MKGLNIFDGIQKLLMGVGVWEGTSRLGPQAISWLAFPFKEPLLLNTWKVEQIVTFSCRQSHSV